MFLYLLSRLILLFLWAVVALIILAAFLEHMRGDKLMAMIGSLMLVLDLIMALEFFDPAFLVLAGVVAGFLYSFMRKKNPWGDFKGIPVIERVIKKAEQFQKNKENK